MKALVMSSVEKESLRGSWSLEGGIGMVSVMMAVDDGVRWTEGYASDSSGGDVDESWCALGGWCRFRVARVA